MCIWFCYIRLHSVFKLLIQPSSSSGTYYRWEYNIISTDLKKIWYESQYWIQHVQNKVHSQCFVNMTMNFRFHNSKFFHQLNSYQLLNEHPAQRNNLFFYACPSDSRGDNMKHNMLIFPACCRSVSAPTDLCFSMGLARRLFLFGLEVEAISSSNQFSPTSSSARNPRISFTSMCKLGSCG